MKKECEIVQDLLFSYNDEVLSNSSKELVEEHLNGCEECKKLLEEIKKDNQNKADKKEIEYLKKVKKTVNKKTVLITLGVALLVIFVLFNIAVFVNYQKNSQGNITIILKDDISLEQRENIENIIKQQYENAKITYFSKEEELDKMKQILGEEILKGYNENNIFYAKYNIKVKENKVNDIMNTLAAVDGIKKMVRNEDNPYQLFLYRVFSYISGGGKTVSITNN